eukprot:gnl/TRDRNA2_/TRDRNA2_167182_c0_seq1.p1 gnl/TRDRNA2_/TRDRNA2_167182_c0~~gnl/TRDRNA2_/TRDRNA2_167182_c0_seq1.p1  ORF type:complete len:498 (-),score=66.28 gnl/TRDRNA2_/TRDRNA2_167182_c0_seq1:95-1588(-)
MRRNQQQFNRRRTDVAQEMTVERLSGGVGQRLGARSLHSADLDSTALGKLDTLAVPDLHIFSHTAFSRFMAMSTARKCPNKDAIRAEGRSCLRVSTSCQPFNRCSLSYLPHRPHGASSVLSSRRMHGTIMSTIGPPLLEESPRAPVAGFERCEGAAVFAVEDASGAVVHVGLSMALAAEIAALSATLPEGTEGMTMRYAATPGWTSACMEELKQQWIRELGNVPPGNIEGADAKWKAGESAVGAVMRNACNEGVSGIMRAAAGSASVLASDGFAVIDDAVPPLVVEVALRGARRLRAAGRARKIASQAALGRTDEILVLGAAPGAPGGFSLRGVPDMDDGDLRAAAAVAMTAGTALAALPQVLGSGLQAPKSLQLACYEGGGTYPRHLDNDATLSGTPAYTAGPPGERICDREVTAILYLNAGDDWEASRDGGVLRIWSPASAASLHDNATLLAEVAPRAGRLVLFNARTVEHEVAPAQRERWALSAWLPGCAESVR